MITPGRLTEVRSFDDLVAFLANDLDWPIDNLDLEDAAFDYEPEDLKIDPSKAPKLETIRELRPLQANQPWGIFFLEFTGTRLPVVELRLVLDRLVTKKRARGDGSNRSWDLDDLLFLITTNASANVELHLVAFKDVGDPLLQVRSLPWSPEYPDSYLKRLETELLPRLAWPEHPEDADDWREQWRAAFQLRHGEAITTATRLAARMAEVARDVHDVIEQAFKQEDGHGPFNVLLKEIRDELVADAEESEFADMCAQTLVYGLLTARLNDPVTFGASPLLSSVPLSNPFLAAFFQKIHESVLELGVDDSGLEALVADLQSSNVEHVLIQFGREAAHSDPVIHFYEEFLQDYDAGLRQKMGAYYTPQPVVEFMVRSVDEIIKSGFGLEHGIADTSTWADVASSNGFEVPDGIEPKRPFVTMIDPATGTGTFLVEWIKQARRSYTEDHPETDWPEHFSSHVTPSMHAFELMLGPYAIAHLKLALESDRDGIEMDPNTALLTDTLAREDAQLQTVVFEDPVAAEGLRARNIKEATHLTICIGNPPYDRVARDAGGGWITDDSEGRCPFDDIHDPAKEHTKFSHHASLFNQYVYFWRWALWKVFEHNQSAPGIVSLITASSWLTGPGFLGMRQLVRELADEVWIVDLGGDNRGTRPEENVFDIETAVAITTIVRHGTPDQESPAVARYTRISGSKDEKLQQLKSLRIHQADWAEASSEWHEPLIPSTGGAAWGTYPALTDLFPWQQPGCMYNRTWPIAPDPGLLAQRWERFLSTKDAADRALCYFTPKTGRNITTQVSGMTPLIDLSTGASPEPVARYAFRSFDRQWTFRDPRLAALDRPALWASLSEQQVFLTTLTTSPLGGGPAATATTAVPDKHHFHGRGGKDVIPLYRDTAGTPNVATDTLNAITTAHQATDDSATAITPESLFCYTYGILAGGDYTDRFAEALETPGPRIPLTADPHLFAEVAAHGEELLWLHTYGERMNTDDRPDRIPTSTTIRWADTPTSIPDDSRDFSYDADTCTLHVADGHLEDVPQQVWEFEVSGMQVVKKWLGYRTGKGAGRAASSTSPLDHIRPTEWSSEWTEELLELLTVLERTLEMMPAGAELLDRVCDGPLIDASDLPEVPEALRKPPKVDPSSAQLSLGT